MTLDISTARKQGAQILGQSLLAQSSQHQHFDFQRDADLLLAHCLKKPTTFLHTWPEQRLSPEQEKQFLKGIEKRAQNYPLAYIIGTQAFWSYEFAVDESVLIPRPETECLIEWLLGHFQGTNETLKVLELGTGSGAIAISLALEKPYWSIYACDISLDALSLAKQNARDLHAHNLEFFHSNWFAAMPDRRFDAIISNPPYVEDNADQFQTESIQFEPEQALKAGADGLDAIREICSQATGFLKPGAALIIEHGFQQAENVAAIFKQNLFRNIQSGKDYAGMDRFTYGFAHES